MDVNNSPSKNSISSSNHSKKPFKPKKMVIDITEEDPNEKLVKADEFESSKSSVFLRSSKNNFFKSLLLDQKFGRVANNGFLNYILDPSNYNFEDYFKK